MFEIKLFESDPPEESDNEMRASHHRTVVAAIRTAVYWNLWIWLLWSLRRH